MLLFFITNLLSAPNSPSSLYFSDITNNSVTLHWIDNSDNESGFKIYRDGKLIYITNPNVTSYQDTFLYHDTSYTYEVKATDDPILNRDKKRILRQIVSIFENSTKELQYWYAQNIDDGRGVTAGIAGFTTGTWDLYELLRRYENIKPNNILSYFKDFNETYTLSKEEEDRLIVSWESEAKNSKIFREVQDKMVDELYYYPAMSVAFRLGYTKPILKLIIYDTFIQHGYLSEDRDDGVHITGLKEIIDLTKKRYSGDNEMEFFENFLDIREDILKDTKGWKDTTYRVKALRDLLHSQNENLDPPFNIHIVYDNKDEDDFYILKKNNIKTNWFIPKSGTTWQWQLSGKLNKNYHVKVYDIDLFDTNRSTIKELKDSGKKVICYFSAGSFEDWREDSDKFPKEVIGKKLDNWDGENWLDIREDSVKNIMKDRIKLAKDKGCDGVEPDNVDGYSNDSGFKLSGLDQINFNIFLANEAHKLGLSIALKNDLEQIKTLEPFFDFALNESCHEYNECSLLKPFLDHNKAVFNAEYNIQNRDEYCKDITSKGFSILFLPEDLDDSFRYSCN